MYCACFSVGKMCDQVTWTPFRAASAKPAKTTVTTWTVPRPSTKLSSKIPTPSPGRVHSQSSPSPSATARNQPVSRNIATAIAAASSAGSAANAWAAATARSSRFWRGALPRKHVSCSDFILPQINNHFNLFIDIWELVTAAKLCKIPTRNSLTQPSTPPPISNLRISITNSHVMWLCVWVRFKSAKKTRRSSWSRDPSRWKTEWGTMASLTTGCAMDWVSRFGLTSLCMKASGKTICRVGEGDWSLQRGMSTKGNGEEANSMAKGWWPVTMGLPMQENGLITLSMGSGLKRWLMAPHMKALSGRDLSMGKGCSLGQINRIMMESSRRIICLDRGNL